MRIAHFSDTHLGLRQLHHTDERGRNIREQDLYAAFDAGIELAIKLEPACVVHAGDLFDSYHPSAAALAVALDGFARLVDAGIPLVLIAGNHSSPRVAAAQHIFSVLERFDRTGLTHAVFGDPRTVRIDGLAIHAVPHHNDADALATNLRAAQPVADADYNIVVAHTGFARLATVGSSEAGSQTLSGEDLQAVGAFDYIALGHLHKYDRVRLNAVYSGSLERLTWADDAPEKGIVEVDLSAEVFDDAWHQLHPVPARPHIRLAPIDAAQVENLTDALVAAAERDDLDGAMVRATVRNVTLAATAAIDRRAVDAAFSTSMHFELDTQIVGERGAVTAPQDLRDFLAARAPVGMETGEFIARAEDYLARASQEIGA